jgi:hypothetical protein
LSKSKRPQKSFYLSDNCSPPTPYIPHKSSERKKERKKKGKKREKRGKRKKFLAKNPLN